MSRSPGAVVVVTVEVVLVDVVVVVVARRKTGEIRFHFAAWTLPAEESPSDVDVLLLTGR